MKLKSIIKMHALSENMVFRKCGVVLRDNSRGVITTIINDEVDIRLFNGEHRRVRPPHIKEVYLVRSV